MCLMVFTHIYLISNMKGAKVVSYSIISLLVLCMRLNICFYPIIQSLQGLGDVLAGENVDTRHLRDFEKLKIIDTF